MKYEFKIDLDGRIDEWGWWDTYLLVSKNTLKILGFKVNKILVHVSPSQKGLHVYFHCEGKRMSQQKVNMMNFLLGDDFTRVKINRNRIKFMNKDWSVLFDKAIYTKPQKENCQKCKLLKYMREAHGKDNKRAKKRS